MSEFSRMIQSTCRNIHPLLSFCNCSAFPSLCEVSVLYVLGVNANWKVQMPSGDWYGSSQLTDNWLQTDDNLLHKEPTWPLPWTEDTFVFLSFQTVTLVSYWLYLVKEFFGVSCYLVTLLSLVCVR